MNREGDGLDRTIGLGSGSNDEDTIFALTFRTLDIILTNKVNSVFHQ